MVDYLAGLDRLSIAFDQLSDEVEAATRPLAS